MCIHGCMKATARRGTGRGTRAQGDPRSQPVPVPRQGLRRPGHRGRDRRPVPKSASGVPSRERGAVGTATTFHLNGKAVSSSLDSSYPLLYVLRDEFQVNGPKFGCGLAECGACTVLVNGVAERSCSIPLASAQGTSVTTLEGLGTPDHPSVVQQAFIDGQAAQCGYCTNGMIMQATSFLRQNPHPTTAEIRTEMQNNLCRCGTQLRIIQAISVAAAKGGA